MQKYIFSKRCGLFTVVSCAVLSLAFTSATSGKQEKAAPIPVYMAEETNLVSLKSRWVEEMEKETDFVQNVLEAKARQAAADAEAAAKAIRSAGAAEEAKAATAREAAKQVQLETKFEAPVSSGDFYIEEIPLSYELQEYTWNITQELGVPYELLLAIMWHESRFTVDAIGYNTNGTQDSGLLQIDDVNRGWLQEELGIEDLLDPKQNILAGATILSETISKYPENLALMSYQYGESGMKSKQAKGITTSKFVDTVLAKRDYYVSLREN